MPSDVVHFDGFSYSMYRSIKCNIRGGLDNSAKTVDQLKAKPE